VLVDGGFCVHITAGLILFKGVRSTPPLSSYLTFFPYLAFKKKRKKKRKVLVVEKRDCCIPEGEESTEFFTTENMPKYARYRVHGVLHN
jgi:hypothetical protein